MRRSSYYIKSILGKIEYLLSGLNPLPGELLVLNYHGTQKRFIPAFERQLDFLAKHFSFFAPGQLENYYYRNVHPSSPSVLITFDDGIKNNLHAARILAEKKISALFFIVPEFVDTTESKQESYFRKNIRQVIDASIGYEKEDMTAMNWEDLLDIIKLGHSLGAHSTTHTLLSATSNDQESFREIVLCQKRIAEATDAGILSFCSPNNSLLSCGPREMKLIRENYRFFFSTIPGSNLTENNPFFIHRSNVEVDWNQGAFIQSIGKWDRKRWEGKNQLFKNIAG